jgi:asparagine synthase (glutamine-hydrolysing)
MCGIVGFFSFEGMPPHRNRWPELINLLAHRGPDEGGYWADGPFFLGHRRLSILDIESGSQPMALADGSLVIVFNGEIYNYLELKKELENAGANFNTTSDTEVLLHGYLHWGKDLPNKLIGMFAFAIADRRRGELFLARDRFGEKPLFISRNSKYIAFSSELRPLTALPELDRSLDLQALGEYLCLNYVPGTSSLLKSVRRVAPAAWVLVSSERSESSVYWHPPAGCRSSHKISFSQAVDEWRERFDDSVRICMRSDVPVGIFLSGGVDSALVAEAAMRQNKLERAYCLDFNEVSHSEFPAASLVARRLGIPLERVKLSSRNLTSFFKLVEHADDPLADSSALAVYTLSQAAAQKNKVVLGGDGGDELFGGYLTYRATIQHRNFFTPLPPSLRQLLSWFGEKLPTTEGKVSLSYKLWRFLRGARLPAEEAHFTWNGTWLPEQAARLINNEGEDSKASEALIRMATRLGLYDSFELWDLQRADLAEYLPNDILAKGDRMTMAHGLELRAPMLDYRLAEMAGRCPEEYKISPRGETKCILRQEAHRIFGPEISKRPKQGFSIPVHSWIREDPEGIFHDLLSPASLKRLQVLNVDEVSRLASDHFSGRRSYGFELWGLAVLAAWYRLRVENTPAPPPQLPLHIMHFDLKKQ